MYRLSGLCVTSQDVPLDRYAPLTGAPADAPVVLRVSREPAPEHRHTHAIELEGFCVIAFGRTAAGWLLKTDELATFIVSEDGRDVVCHPTPDCDATHIASMFVDRVIPHLVDARGAMALHASAVSCGEGAAGFLGEPGAGKSTLSAALCPPARYLCDDCAALDVGEAVFVHPSYAFARLNEDAAHALGATDDIHTLPTRAHKWRSAREPSHERQPLRALYVLDRGELGITPLSQRDAIVELARHLYRVDPTDRARLLRELDRLAELTRLVPVRRLRYPRRFDALPAVVDAILADLSA